MSKATNATKADKVNAKILSNPIADPRDQSEKLLRIAATKGKVSTTDADGTTRKVTIAPVLPKGVEGTIKDVLNGRVGSRTQVIHSILIDAARRNVVMTTQGIQAALESYLGEGHGAAYAHLNTLNGKGSSATHPCKVTPYVHHNDVQIPDGWGLTYAACQLAYIDDKDMPSWVVKPTTKAKKK